ncbi:hypothetical protein, partial [Lysobacter sp. TAB13]
MYQEVHTENIVERAHAPEVAELLQRFALHAPGAGGVPYEALLQDLMPRFGDDLMVCVPTGDGDYRYEHYGREITRYV